MKKKNIIIIIATVIIIAIIAIIVILINNNKPKTSINDFSSIKELIEYDGHEYVGMQNSEEEGYEKDIYLKFSKFPINDDGTTNQGIYEIVISHVAGKLKGQNFRMLDQENNILVKIQFDEDGNVSLYTINDDSKYWEHIKSNYQINNYQDETISNLTITSRLLANIINNNWIYNNISLGTKESTVNSYDIFFDEGYKIRKIGKEIYNIVFNKNYANEILQGVSTTTSVENVEKLLGNPTFEDNINNIIGYKSQYFYIFFTGDEVSIYHPDKYDEEESEKFGKLVTELNKSGDMNTFLNKLTDLYTDYSNYYMQNNYINIIYPLRGFSVTMGASSQNGITLYNNFQGYITDSITIEDLKANKQMPANVYTNLSTNLVYNDEVIRKTQDDLNRTPYDRAYLAQTDEYTVLKNENSYTFYSRNKNKVDSVLNVNNMTSMAIYDETTFIYGVKDDGIYIYNAQNMNLRQITSGQGDFNITRIENNTIYYDNTSINL